MGITYGSLFPTSDRIKIDMSEEIYRLTPKATPFWALLSNVAKASCHNIHPKWQESEFFLTREIASGDAVVASVDSNKYIITLTNAEDFRAFETGASTSSTNIIVDLLVVGGAQAGNAIACYCRPQSDVDYPIDRANMQVTLERYSGDTCLAVDQVQVSVFTAATVYDSTNKYYGGLRQGTGAVQESRKKVTIMDTATQIFKTSMSVTGSLQETQLFGGSELERQHLRKAKEFNLDIERALLFSGRGYSEALGATFPTDDDPLTRLTGLGVGIAATSDHRGYIRSKTYGSSGDENTDYQIDVATDYSGFSDGLDTILGKVFECNPGNTERVALCSRNWMAAFPKAARKDNFIRTEMSKEEYGIRLTKYKSTFGDLQLVYEPQFKGQFEDYMVLVDFSLMKIRPLGDRDTKLYTNIQANDIDGRQDQLMAELAFQVRNESAFAICDLKRS